MRIVIGLFFVLLAASFAFAQDDERPRCENCGMYWDSSATRVQFTVEIDDETYTHRTECFGCLHDFIHENYGEVMPSAISVLDYATFGTKSEKMIDGFEAHYLFGTSRLKGSMPPFVAAFASEKAAREHQEELGGELADFNAMRKMMMKAKGEDEPSGHEGHGGEGMADALYVCPCSGDCCSDISSKDPGECPNCGMELVQKS